MQLLSLVEAHSAAPHELKARVAVQLGELAAGLPEKIFQAARSQGRAIELAEALSEFTGTAPG